MHQVKEIQPHSSSACDVAYLPPFFFLFSIACRFDASFSVCREKKAEVSIY
jgi:hypothetical protein